MSPLHSWNLGSPLHVWRRWIVLAAASVSAGSDEARIQPDDGVAMLTDQNGAWLRMRRYVGDRAVLWGHHPDLKPSEEFYAELLDSAPGWATNSAERRVWAPEGIGLCAWFSHGWSSPGRFPSTSPDDFRNDLPDDLAGAFPDDTMATWLGQLGDDDEAVAAACRIRDDVNPTALARLLASPTIGEAEEIFGPAGAEQFELSRTWSMHLLTGPARAHLVRQIHAQMRDAEELLDRGHPRRPRLLRQWFDVNGDGVPFRVAVSAISASGRLVFSSASSGLDPARKQSLTNVLSELRLAESSSESGCWLFAQVEYDGRRLMLDRRYDSWPVWYAAATDAQRPSLDPLADEMRHRTPRARPAWAMLLPR